MSTWVEMRHVHECWDPTGHAHWRRWMAGEVEEEEARRYAALHAELLAGLAAGAERIAVALGSERLAGAAAADRALARRWADLAAAAPIGGPAACRAADECAAVWSGAEAGDRRLERLLVLHAVAELRSAVAVCALGALAGRDERPHDGRELLVAEAANAARLAEVVRALADGAAPLRVAGAVSFAEAALSAYWDLLDEVRSAVGAPPALLAA